MTAAGGRRAIRHQADVEAVQRMARDLAADEHFSRKAAGEATLIASELATNILRHAIEGEIAMHIEHEGGRACVVIEAADRGPGIADVEAALREGVSTAGGLGLGLPMARRLADQFDLATSPEGTRIVARKWRS